MKWIRAIALSATFMAAVAAHERVLHRRATFPADSDVLYVPPANHLKVMSLGYREALADLIWIRALLFSGEHLGKASIEWVDRYLEGITSLSPRFRRPYVWGGITAVYGGQKQVTRPMVERATAVYRRGLEQFPEDHELLFSLGMLLTHQVRSTPGYRDEEKAELAAQGAEAIRKAAAFGADPLVRQYAATLITDYASETLAIQFLETQLLWADDEAYRRMLRKKLAELIGAEATRSIEAIREQFMAELHERYPYVPEALYAVIRSDAGPFRAR